jgi:outer membrane protein assembly factor BamB
MRRRIPVTTFVITILAGSAFAADWSRFRGPNGSGVGEATGLPKQFGPEKNVVWRTPVPFGHSSPVIGGDLIFLTGAEGGSRADAGENKVVDQGGKLYTLAISRKTGAVVWKREVPRPRLERYQPTNSPASPTPVTDGENAYVFFGDFGLLAYSRTGVELWRVPLGPFNNVNGHGSSPILFQDSVILVCDDDNDSYLLAVDKKTGRVRWKTPRPEVTRSYGTPAVFQPKDGPAELIVPGSYQVTSYYAVTGEKAWWVRGLSYQPKSTPVIDGDTIYVHAWDNGGDSRKPVETPPFPEMLAKRPTHNAGKLAVNEFANEPKLQKTLAGVDLNGDGFVDEREWDFYRAKKSAHNNLMAIRHGGHGDLTATNVIWSMQKFIPNCPSPLIYQGVMYLIREGGIFTALDPKTGRILKQARLPGALDNYYASPVAADDKIFLLSQQGKAVVIKPGADWELLEVNDLDDETFATPAILDNRLYIRTRRTLYCFSDKE